MSFFKSEQDSHEHSLQTLNWLQEHDDFMGSIGTLIDMGCGSGLDLEWWATRTTRDDYKTPLNIQCLGVDVFPYSPVANRYKNTKYISQDFELPITADQGKYDVLWSHNSFQYAINPIRTLSTWWDLINENGMAVIIVPQTTNIEFNRQAFVQFDYCYHNWTVVSLIHALAVSGFDCSSGFFLKNPNDPWIHAVVYKSEHPPMDPRTTRWYDLAEKNLLPESAAESVNRRGFLAQPDLLLPWIDKSLMSFNKH